ncbi:MAG: methyltransferase [bacterium]|nr:methyltransferase [bacterium]
MRLRIDAEVFCPELTHTSSLMLSCLKQVAIDPGSRVLDVFTGSGVFAVYLASRGCHVVAVDKSVAAVECASYNAAQNGVGHLVDLRLGDVLSPLGTRETFDLVIACPPLLPGQPSSQLEEAVLDPELGATVRFIEGLASHLTPDGSSLIVLSDVFSRVGHNLADICARCGLRDRIIAHVDAGYETYSVHELRRA